MSDKNLFEDKTTYESDDGADELKGAVVIDFPSTASSATGRAENAIHYQTYLGRQQQQKQQRPRRDFRDKISLDQIRKKADKEIINYAYNSIVDALDYEIERIERSNLFDEWKDTLETIISEVNSISVNHRKILGAIIVATKDKDIANFTTKELFILRDATYMFKQLRVSRSDSKRTIKKLIDISSDMAIPLSTEGMSDTDEESLNQLMKSLIARSK
ncbi:MAG: hypothetical protein K8R79_02935 [Calditrichales bacterium]|nr:hypothetical protein [Calditrichales bacterium]